MKKTYYVFKHPAFGYVRGIQLSAAQENRGGFLTFGLRRDGASRFNTPAAALTAIQKHARYADNMAPGLILVRVEESPRPARRELVTKGDISLLDSGPVVLFGNNIQKYLGVSNYFTENSIETAVTFPNQGQALAWLAQQDKVASSISVRPIREIQDEASVTETVLA